MAISRRKSRQVGSEQGSRGPKSRSAHIGQRDLGVNPLSGRGAQKRRDRVVRKLSRFTLLRRLAARIDRMDWRYKVRSSWPTLWPRWCSCTFFALILRPSVTGATLGLSLSMELAAQLSSFLPWGPFGRRNWTGLRSHFNRCSCRFRRNRGEYAGLPGRSIEQLQHRVFALWDSSSKVDGAFRRPYYFSLCSCAIPSWRCE